VPLTSQERLFRLMADGDGRLLPGAAEASAEIQRLVDEETRSILFEAYCEGARLLAEHRAKLDALAHGPDRARDTRRPGRLLGGRRQRPVSPRAVLASEGDR
jgi:hypothetical protein